MLIIIIINRSVSYQLAIFVALVVGIERFARMQVLVDVTTVFEPRWNAIAADM